MYPNVFFYSCSSVFSLFKVHINKWKKKIQQSIKKAVLQFLKKNKTKLNDKKEVSLIKIKFTSWLNLQLKHIKITVYQPFNTKFKDCCFIKIWQIKENLFQVRHFSNLRLESDLRMKTNIIMTSWLQLKFCHF